MQWSWCGSGSHTSRLGAPGLTRILYDTHARVSVVAPTYAVHMNVYAYCSETATPWSFAPLHQRALSTSWEATLQGPPYDLSWRRAAGWLRAPITLLQGPYYEHLLMCLPKYWAGSEGTKHFVASVPHEHLNLSSSSLPLVFFWVILNKLFSAFRIQHWSTLRIHPKILLLQTFLQEQESELQVAQFICMLASQIIVCWKGLYNLEKDFT